LNGQAFVRNKDEIQNVMVKVSSPRRKPELREWRYIIKGSLDNLNDGGIIIGSEMADRLNFKLGDTVLLSSPMDTP